MQKTEFQRRDLLRLSGLGLLGGIGGVAQAGVGDTGTSAEYAAETGRGQSAQYAVTTDVGETLLVHGDRQVGEIYSREFPGRLLTVTSAGAESAVTAQSEDIEVAVSLWAPDQTGGGEISPESTVFVYTGVYDESGVAPEGLENETLDVSIERPDGDTETFSLTTGEHGTAELSYDLSEPDREDGTYSVTVDHEDAFSPIVSFSSGLSVQPVTDTEFGALQTGREHSISFLARAGMDPQTGVPLDLRVSQGETVVKETSTSADDEGFATISFTPEAAGTYTVEAIRDDTVVSSAEYEAAAVTCGCDLSLMHAIPGERAFFGGYLSSADGFVSDQAVELQIATSEEVLVDRTLRTDDSGFFATSYDLPTVFEGFTPEIQAEFPDGTQIPVRVRSLELQERTATEPGPVVLTAATDRDTYAPGETIDIELSATDEGVPITDESVAVFLRYGDDGAPLFSETVRTDENGTATVSVTAPDLDGTQITGTAGLAYEGETYQTPVLASVRKYDLSFQPSSVVPEETTTFEFEATDRETGEAVADVKEQITTEYATAWSGSYGTASQETTDEGTDDAEIEIPTNVQFQSYATRFSRYWDGTLHRILRPERPGTLSVETEPIVGENLGLFLETPDGTTARGIVFTELGSHEHAIGTSIDSESAASIQLPSLLEDGDSFTFRLWAADEDGQLYSDTERVTVEERGIEVGLSPASLQITPDSDQILDLTVEEATAGIQSYDVTIEVEEPSVLEITGFNVRNDPDTVDVDFDEDGSWIEFDVEMGANEFEPGDATIVQIEVQPRGTGATGVTLDELTVRSAPSDQYNLVETTEATVTVVESGGPPPVVDESPPRDPDGDGLYEDLNGDGAFDIFDVRTLFNNLDDPVVQNNAEFYNFSGDDGNEVNIFDIRALFDELS